MLQAYLIVDARLQVLIYFNFFFSANVCILQCIIKIGPSDKSRVCERERDSYSDARKFNAFNEKFYERTGNMMAKSACECHRHIITQLNFNFPSSNA